MGSDTTKTLMHVPRNECRAPHILQRMRDVCPLVRLGFSRNTLCMDPHLGQVIMVPDRGALPHIAAPLSPAPSFFGLLLVAIVGLLWAEALDCGHRQRLALAVGPVCVGSN